MALIPVGRIGKPRGVRGEFWVDPYWERSDLFAEGEPVWTGEGTGPPREVERFFVYAKGSVMKLRGVDDRNAAEGFEGLELLLPEARAPREGPETFDTQDVVGYSVVDASRGAVGTVTGVARRPAYWVFLVDAGGEEAEIPAVKGLGVEVDAGGRTIRVDLPSGYPGLPGDEGDAD
jgi:16S rRNA processing protein RimM